MNDVLNTPTTDGAEADAAVGDEQTAGEQQNRFQVRLTNFEGPFDLLLQLIFAHRLDVTEVALHQVTDDFIAYTKEIGARLELDETTTFLVIAATLLDLKAARLLLRAKCTTRRISPCSRSATSCSLGCCSTGRSNTSH